MTVARPLFLQGLTDYTASEFRNLTDAVWPNAGVLSGLAVAVTGPASMNVTVAPGYAIIPTAWVGAGKYLFRVSTTETVTVAASGALPRVDLLVAQVLDTEFAGSTDAGAVRMIPGVPAAVPVPSAMPAGSVLLGIVTVRAGAASITAADLTQAAFTSRAGNGGKLTRNSTIGLISGGWFNLPMDTTVYADGVSIGTATITTTTAGRYQINGYLQHPGYNTVGLRAVGYSINGLQQLESSSAAATTNNQILSVSALATLAAGDSVALMAYQSSGFTIVVGAGSLSIARVG